MKEHDSTIVYYRITQGLVPPDSPETARKKKQREEKKHCIEMEMRKMRQELFEKALSGVSESEKAQCSLDDVETQEELASEAEKTVECENREVNSREPNDTSTQSDNENSKTT